MCECVCGPRERTAVQMCTRIYIYLYVYMYISMSLSLSGRVCLYPFSLVFSPSHRLPPLSLGRKRVRIVEWVRLSRNFSPTAYRARSFSESASKRMTGALYVFLNKIPLRRHPACYSDQRQCARELQPGWTVTVEHPVRATAAARLQTSTESEQVVDEVHKSFAEVPEHRTDFTANSEHPEEQFETAVCTLRIGG